MIIKLLAVLHDIYKHVIVYSLRTAFLQVTITIGGSYLLSWLFRGILVTSGFPGLSMDNIHSFLANPLTFLLLLIYLLVLAFLVFIEFSFLVEILRYKDTPLELGFDYFKTDCKNFINSIRGRHFFAFLSYLLMTIPVLRFFFSSALIERLYIPEFIIGELQKSQSGQVGLFIVYALLFYINSRLVYTLPLTVTRKESSFTDNLKTSWQMTAGRSLLTLIGLAVIAGTITLLSMIAAGLLLGSLSLLFRGNSGTEVLAQTILVSLTWLILFAASLLIKLASLAYLILELEQNDILDVKPSPQRRKSRWVRLLLLNIIVAFGAFFYYANRLGNGDPEKVNIIAHRGYVDKAVENSMEGLKASKKAGADMVEIDVLMTKDKQFIINHDDDLRRLSGQAKRVSQSKAKDIIGQTLRQNEHTSQIVSFQRFLEEAQKLNLPLLIELKPTKHQPDYAEYFLKELSKVSPHPQNQFMSLDLKLIETIEKKRPDLKTGHVITFQFGDFISDKVDFYALEEFSYTNHIAKLARNKHKDLYIWTINDQKQLARYLKTPIDGIITDYPNKARYEQKHMTNKPQDYLTFLMRLYHLD
ncbi:glycerophosphodiester phosphodiesterase [Streptococcus halotolerans]|uniref:glycerophosphodiester phosphodiesterase n=1 Tax=Streptococcus halotolerans TaxID=1814128 RepID=UPI0007879A4B|nr:glycerophosphodiester phosphodiesterase [Streptococcus halotolerans]